jgi:glycosyltransferase involved in cell wall biosynthesis
MTPAVSVIIPTYNRVGTLGRAIRSVLAQTHQDFEIVTVDDGSTDRTPELIESLEDPRLRFVRHERNLGAGAARNTGVRRARGACLAFLDSDDEWTADTLRQQMRTIEAGGYLSGVAYAGIVSLDDDGHVRWTFLPDRSGLSQQDFLVSNQIPALSGVLVRREYFERVGGFDESLPSCQDWDLYLRLSRVCAFHPVPEVLVKYHALERLARRRPSSRGTGACRPSTRRCTRRCPRRCACATGRR